MSKTRTEKAGIAWRCLERAVDRFNLSIDQRTLLQPRDSDHMAAASERAIAHRLAVYLESELRRTRYISDQNTLVVDCEYNRHGDTLKALAVEEELKKIVDEARKKRWGAPDEDGFYVFSVAPDIVVHQRGSDDQNLLVIEVKKATNKESPKYDALKLALFTRLKENRDKGYGYNFGAWIIAEDEHEGKSRKLRIATKYERGTSTV